VGVGLGLIALGREGVSFAMLRRMSREEEELAEAESEAPAESRARARVPG
jgi:hypothetical protein